jgi:hypothetical protein
VARLGAYRQFEPKFSEQKRTDLGLSIAKRLTELHGRRMEFDLEEKPGKTVLVHLPASKLSQKPPHSHPELVYPPSCLAGLPRSSLMRGFGICYQPKNRC